MSFHHYEVSADAQVILCFRVREDAAAWMASAEAMSLWETLEYGFVVWGCKE